MLQVQNQRSDRPMNGHERTSAPVVQTRAKT